MLFDRWRARRANKSLIENIHGEIVAAARAREIYALFRVPDDVDGRFEMVVLHAGLVLRRLGELGEKAAPLAQDIVDRVFIGLDDALRELSISDIGVARRIRGMAEAFYGRSAVYNAALAAENPQMMADALARNAYRRLFAGGDVAPSLLARRVFALAEALESIDLATFTEGRFKFPAGPGEAS